MSKRLKLSKEMEKIDAAGDEFSNEINSQDKSLRTKKVRILNDIVFQAMADLTFFFNSIALHSELQSSFDNDIKDLLGVRRENLQGKPPEYGFMLLSLLRSILIIRDIEYKERPRNKQDDFRLKLNHILQGIVFDKVRPSLIDIFKLQEAQIAVKDDFHRVWAWTGTLASNIDDEQITPRRTFDFDVNELLK
jgi:hypothetical protein